jgi:hypothetical protein
MLKSIAIRAAVALAFLSPAMAEDVLQPTDATAAAAGEVPQAVIDACQNDFEKHCKKHEPESAAARDCMAGVFEKLSDPCVTAILDSPLVEQQQQLANARGGEENSTAGPKTADETAGAGRRKGRSAQTAIDKSSFDKSAHAKTAAKPAARTGKAKHAAPAKYAAAKSKRHVAQRASGPKRSVAGHIRRGTGIANYYVAKYTRFAFAKAFR